MCTCKENRFPCTVNIKICIEVDEAKNKYMVSFKDQGPRFKEKNTENIFKRFYSNRPKNFGEHSGLGLNIVKNIIELHKGKIKAINRTDVRGAQIEVVLPKYSQGCRLLRINYIVKRRADYE